MNIKYKTKSKKNKNKKLKILSCLFFFFLISNFLFLIFPVELLFAKIKVEKKQVVTSIPTIYPRSSWSNAKYDKRTKKIWPAEYDDPKVIIIHHTATNYKHSTSKQIKKIYRYHSYTRRWGDIGYNYIIGKDGLIFEGRYGGNGVIGGHAYFNGTNYNKGSIGIAVLGNYEEEKLSSAARDSLEKLVGWLAANNNISIKARVKFYGKALDNSVVGHRDVASTTCPGKNIYSLISDIRASAESLSGTYRNYAYQISGDNEKYEIYGGKRYSGSSKTPVVQISETQLKAYPLSEVAQGNSDYTYPSGTLLLSAGRRAVLENGILRVINSDSVLKSSYNSLNFVEVSDEEWNNYLNGAEASFRDGSFVKSENQIYYMIYGNQKRKLDLASEDLRFIDLSVAHNVSSNEIDQYPDGENITSVTDFPKGTLITADNKKVYYVSGTGIKKKITPSVFRATFSQSMIVRVSGKLLRRYKTKGKLSFQNGAVVSYRGKYYFIENGKRREFSSKNLANRMGYKNIQKAKRTEMAGIGEGTKIE